MSNTAPVPTPSKDGKSLDGIMLAMDVVDTLRHRKQLVAKELSADDRRGELLARLREIYESQGIEVPDSVLEEGVKALEEGRFTYEPPKQSFSTRLAKIYVNRGRWLKPIAFVAGSTAFLSVAYWGSVVQPQRAEVARTEIALTQDIPTELKLLRDEGAAIANTDIAKARLNALYQDGTSAVAVEDLSAAQKAVAGLEDLNRQLKQTYTIRIINRPGENSGVWRVPDVNMAAQNYYLIVEAIDPSGAIVKVDIMSEESGTVKRVDKWGVRVAQATYEAVGRNKSDDGIIQNPEIGQKLRGKLEQDYTIATGGGMIWEW